jgi:hypothetical protein
MRPIARLMSLLHTQMCEGRRQRDLDLLSLKEEEEEVFINLKFTLQ